MSLLLFESMDLHIILIHLDGFCECAHQFFEHGMELIKPRITSRSSSLEDAMIGVPLLDCWVLVGSELIEINMAIMIRL